MAKISLMRMEMEYQTDLLNAKPMHRHRMMNKSRSALHPHAVNKHRLLMTMQLVDARMKQIQPLVKKVF